MSQAPRFATSATTSTAPARTAPANASIARQGHRRLPAHAPWALVQALALVSSVVLTLAPATGHTADAPTGTPAATATTATTATTAATATTNSPAAPVDNPAQAAAMAQFNRAVAGDDSAVDSALAQYRALMAADPAQPVWRAYAGAATTMQARSTLLPWKKMAYADDGLALIDKALAQLSPAHDSKRVGGVPASLLVRFTAAGTFNAMPAMFNRGDRGARLMDELLKSPLLASAPLGFRGAVWLRAADDAVQAQRADESRQWLRKVVASGAPQAPLAQARLRAL